MSCTGYERDQKGFSHKHIWPTAKNLVSRIRWVYTKYDSEHWMLEAQSNEKKVCNFKS